MVERINMKETKIDKSYLLLKKWWESIDLTNYEKSNLNKEIISFNQQLFRLKEKHLKIGIYGKSGVGKSYILNLLLNKNEFKTDIINGSTKNIAGVFNKEKNVLGMMPHPERMIDQSLSGEDGSLFFKNLINNMK